VRRPKTSGRLSCSDESPSFAVELHTDPAVNQVNPRYERERLVLNGNADLHFLLSGASISTALGCWNTNEHTSV